VRHLIRTRIVEQFTTRILARNKNENCEVFLLYRLMHFIKFNVGQK